MKTRVVRYFDARVGWLYRVEAQDYWLFERNLPMEQRTPYWRVVAGQLSESCAMSSAEALSKLDAVPPNYSANIDDIVAEFG